ncbi:FmdB family zinc ribbon protein [Calditerrivibrio nitroreducens]|uniref:Regulatory protein, FmdB family n=1 Tax=Calditerrivibrio nitroreducens (strain DSM 19672 / NBRC 101217 / Yu37-1) TaxID=768670 RepID=E4THP6_CALNY|nr:zinc ribbon domain-containing protein [Calditerrivibrio nitroreducens]ADR18871.1 regulatory protein, FmdB family [Calditerrivibrio nitroreducens DSM 19672]
MPIYEYKCTKCNHIFELLEPTFNDVKEKKCVKCGSSAERIMSLTSFQLKGSGWYKTDYANKPCSSTESNASCSSCPANTATEN